MGCGCESESGRGLEAEEYKKVSDVVDEARIGVELILPAGVCARPPVFALALHGNFCLRKRTQRAGRVCTCSGGAGRRV